MAQNQQAYYDDSSRHGEYQYITLEQLVNDYMMSLDDDDYTYGVDRHRVVYHAKKSIQQLYYDVANEIKAIEIEMSTALTYILPDDFVNYVRISWVDEDGLLHPMAQSNLSSRASAYLQDQDYNILFDDDGCILEGTGERDDVGDRERFSSRIREALTNYFSEYNFYGGSCRRYYTDFNIDFSKFFINGSYQLDRENGVIRVSSDSFERNIVLEYLSDGLSNLADNEIRIHKFAEHAVLSYIYYKLIMNRRNVPFNDKVRARREMNNERRIAKARIHPIRSSELRQVLKGQNKWIKS